MGKKLLKVHLYYFTSCKICSDDTSFLIDICNLYLHTPFLMSLARSLLILLTICKILAFKFIDWIFFFCWFLPYSLWFFILLSLGLIGYFFILWVSIILLLNSII